MTVHALECPEDYLWVRHHDREMTAIDAARIAELRSGARPEGDVEARLAARPDWLSRWLRDFAGEVPVEIDAVGPLPVLPECVA